MRLVLVYSKHKKNSWLRVYDDFDGTARLAIRMAGWSESHNDRSPDTPKNVTMILLQPGITKSSEARTLVSSQRWRKNYRALVNAVKPFGLKVEGPFQRRMLKEGIPNPVETVLSPRITAGAEAKS